jgi:AmmeMemoRadiSam system protein B/AmmeMemoRadiSam system protein A
MFYPAAPDQLKHEVQQFLAGAAPSDLIPKALIVPHAGYVYSGAIAATAYATLLPIAAHIRRVVLLGPTHRVAVRGLALPGADAFDTPLGRIMLDQAAQQSILHLPHVSISALVHAQEHSLEVQLPFLQSVLSDFTLLPLAVGMASADEVAEVLEIVWGGDETLIVISSDLSHFLPYASAQRMDKNTTDAILRLHQPIDHEQACGGTPINGLIVAALHHQLTPHLLDLRNSGDTAGAKDRVVGYASFAFTKEGDNMSNKVMSIEQGKVLLSIARAAISRALNLPLETDETAPWLAEKGACFVTLTQQGELRGCIGTLQAHRSLLDDVKNNAVSAALRDPRFPPLSAQELNLTSIEVSLLSPTQAIVFNNEADALAQLRPGVDGIVFEFGRYRSTFLPQVWEQLPQPTQFMAQLKFKAGLPVNFWAEGIKLSRYTVTKWHEGQH